ncbi:hypothetical protein PROFUN_00787 [Planoprotostelium fungivorum]|uniref:Carbohydrate kinase PfkB domain-containing protein n=1 Tax=Planoprotostelium fungivorum TaxID=1890364 RepID=A0A2P6NZX9_9EUKA|nr:hypothetical protein PROFUN_00787 [Planoprotostelium fungivorum]
MDSSHKNMMIEQLPLDFVTMGMFIIDDIIYEDGSEKRQVIGGGGTWALLGARLHRPPPSSSRLSMIVHTGHDFPENIKEDLFRLDTNTILRPTPHRLTTRGLNVYKSGQDRGFTFMTEKQRVEIIDLDGDLLISKSAHHSLYRLGAIPRFSLEHAIPSSETDNTGACSVDHLEQCKEAMKVVTVLTPNHAEACGLLDIPFEDTLDHAVRVARTFLEFGVGEGKGCVIIRCGSLGCILADIHGTTHFPAFWDVRNLNRVIDPTGAGNAFCGGLCIGLSITGDTKEAITWAQVSSSFAIEQIGMPSVQVIDGTEMWNNEGVQERKDRYRERLTGRQNGCPY